MIELDPCALKQLAKRLRIHALRMTSSGGSAHLGSCLSCADILAVLYGAILRVDPKNPKSPTRDRFVMSKGHAGAILYATLAEIGFFPTSELSKHYQNGSIFSGHVSHKGVPGVEVSTGSLGHGLSVAAGMALAAKRTAAKHRVYCLLSDGECDEGMTWEAGLFAAHHKLTQLCALIDFNKIQSLGDVSEVLDLEPFADKWRSFGWDVSEVDGHSIEQLIAVLSEKRSGDRPRCIICHTIKGKGVSFMQGQLLWHYRTARGEEFDSALKELSES